MSRALAALPLLLAACSSSAEYTCPEPVGRIIRDDCEVYRTRYEALKVELGASLGPMGANVALGQQALRDPSELLQVLAHRTHALCRDFNACRVMPLEYRQRREQTDCIFTAVSAIQSQLKQELDAESKARLVRELTRVLSGETCGGGAGATGAAAAPDRPRRPAARAATAYRSSWPWFGTVLLPPQPPAVEGFPRLVRAEFSLQHVFRQRSPRGVVGYRPRVSLGLWGKTAGDDMVIVDWGAGRSECAVGRGRNGLAGARCSAPESLTLTGSRFGVTVSYRRGVDGETHELGRRRVEVLVRREEGTKNNSHRYGISHERAVRQGWLELRPDGRRLPPQRERPHLVTVLRMRKLITNETARCWVDGKLITRAIEGHQEHLGQFQDRPRYRRVGPGSSVGVAEPFVRWRRVSFALPFVVSRGGTAAKGDKAWPVAGSWRCVVVLDGEPVRELRFTVKPDGRLEPQPGQTRQARAAWLVRTRVLKNPVEGRLEPRPAAQQTHR